MGGLIAIALKRKGRTTTRILPKYAAAGLSRGDFFEGHGLFWDEWKQGEKHSLVPYDYGLVVIDFDKKWAAGIQNYCDFAETHVRLNRSNDVEDFKRLWEQDRVNKVAVYSSTADIPIPFPGGKKNCTFEMMMQKINLKYSDSDTLIVQIKPPKGWEIEDLFNDDLSWAKFITLMKAKGLEIKLGDVEEWETYLQEKISTTAPLDALKSERAAVQLEKQTSPARATPRAHRM